MGWICGDFGEWYLISCTAVPERIEIPWLWWSSALLLPQDWHLWFCFKDLKKNTLDRLAQNLVHGSHSCLFSKHDYNTLIERIVLSSLDFLGCWSLPLCTLHVLTVHTWVIFRYSGFLPRSKDMFTSINPARMSVNGACLPVRPATDWRTVQCVFSL